MHFVWATAVNGDKVPVNLEHVATMLRGKNDKGVEATSLFYGHIAVSVQGAVTYANTQVLETPEQLFTLPRIEMAPTRSAVKASRK